jgi:hypothetical protein
MEMGTDDCYEGGVKARLNSSGTRAGRIGLPEGCRKLPITVPAWSNASNWYDKQISRSDIRCIMTEGRDRPEPGLGSNLSGEGQASVERDMKG